MVGGVRQHSAATVALGAADDRLSPEFPNFAAAENLLHTDRVDLTEINRHHHIYVYRIKNIFFFLYFLVYNNIVENNQTEHMITSSGLDLSHSFSSISRRMCNIYVDYYGEKSSRHVTVSLI